jgi:hypothetical protein
MRQAELFHSRHYYGKKNSHFQKKQTLQNPLFQNENMRLIYAIGFLSGVVRFYFGTCLEPVYFQNKGNNRVYFSDNFTFAYAVGGVEFSLQWVSFCSSISYFHFR